MPSSMVVVVTSSTVLGWWSCHCRCRLMMVVGRGGGCCLMGWWSCRLMTVMGRGGHHCHGIDGGGEGASSTLHHQCWLWGPVALVDGGHGVVVASSTVVGWWSRCCCHLTMVMGRGGGHGRAVDGVVGLCQRRHWWEVGRCWGRCHRRHRLMMVAGRGGGC